MTVTQFDAHNGEQITTTLTGPDYAPVIDGPGYFIIPNAYGAKAGVSFSKGRHDACLGDITLNVIPDYTNDQYAAEYGHRYMDNGMTVLEYMQQNLRLK